MYFILSLFSTIYSKNLNTILQLLSSDDWDEGWNFEQ